MLSVDDAYCYILVKIIALIVTPLNGQEHILFWEYLNSESGVTTPQIRQKWEANFPQCAYLDLNNVNTHLNNLVKMGLVAKEETLQLTEKGVRWLNEFRIAYYDDLS